MSCPLKKWIILYPFSRDLDSSAFGLVAVVGEAFHRLNADATTDLIHTGYYYSGDFGLGPDGTLCYADEGPVCVDPDGTEHWLDFFSESFEFDVAGTLYSTDTDNVYRVESGLRTPLISGGAAVQGRLILSGTAGGVAYQANLVRDKLGRITQKTEIVEGEGTLWEYGYDTAGGLETVIRNGVDYAVCSYDDNGNRLSKTQGSATVNGRHDDQDRLLTYGNNQYSYTANGELLSKTGSDGLTGYTYDVLGNLMKVELPDGTVIEYLIDGQNRRIGKKVNGALVQGLLYKDQLNPVAELDGQGRIVARFVYGEMVHVPAYMVKVDPVSGAEKTYRIVADHLGSPRLVIDVETREIVHRMDYDEFGVVIKDSKPGFQPFGFAGGLYDPLTKLVRFGARDYDAETGRWTTKDPIGFKGGEPSLYVYVSNNPVNFFDIYGLCQDGSPWWDKALDFLGDKGVVSATFNAGRGIGVSGQVFITRTGVYGYIGGGFGVGFGGSITGGFKSGSLSGLTAKASVSGGNGPGASAAAGVSQGGSLGAVGVGLGLGVGASATVGYTGAIYEFNSEGNDARSNVCDCEQ